MESMLLISAKKKCCDVNFTLVHACSLNRLIHQSELFPHIYVEIRKFELVYYQIFGSTVAI